jgi:hypothetical protein
VMSGVKHGGVCSHVLFAIYVDKLLVDLSEAGTSVGALAYADDIILMSPPASTMSYMLAICVTRL